MLKDNKEFLKRNLLFDGAMGTELQRRGLPIGIPPELWNMENPNIVEEIHRDYISSGAMVIETNTFGGNRLRLKRKDLEGKVKEINKRAVEIALKFKSKGILIAGSVGPLGELIEPYGDITEEEAEEIFSEQIEILRDSGVDFILIETMISLDEAKIALRSAKRLGCIVGVTMSFEWGAKGGRTPFGDEVEISMRELEKEGVDFVGANCGKGIEDMRKIAPILRKSTNLPILIQPNAGMPQIINRKLVYSESPSNFAIFVEEMLDLGVNFIGGCCGTNPEFIKEAYKVFKEKSRI
ncbi:MAG: homocysteine S-methyltransferase family protein [Dictyoglomaceae bacterium]